MPLLQHYPLNGVYHSEVNVQGSGGVLNNQKALLILFVFLHPFCKIEQKRLVFDSLDP